MASSRDNLPPSAQRRRKVASPSVICSTCARRHSSVRRKSAGRRSAACRMGSQYPAKHERSDGEVPRFSCLAEMTNALLFQPLCRIEVAEALHDVAERQERTAKIADVVGRPQNIYARLELHTRDICLPQGR